MSIWTPISWKRPSPRVLFVTNCLAQLLAAALTIAGFYLVLRELATQTGPDTR